MPIITHAHHIVANNNILTDSQSQLGELKSLYTLQVARQFSVWGKNGVA